MILMGPSAASLQRLVTSAPEKPGVDNRTYQQIINEFCKVCSNARNTNFELFTNQLDL